MLSQWLLCGWLLWGLAQGCGSPVQLTATALQPAGLPLRSFPHVFIVRGHLPEEQKIARGLSAWLQRKGHVSAPVVEEAALEQRRARRGLPPGSVVVELALGVRELTYQQYAPSRTVCDSLSCYVLPSTVEDLPVLKARLVLTVRDGETLAVRQEVVVRAIEAAESPRQLRREVTLTLVERLRLLVDQRRLLVRVDLLSPDFAGIDAAVDAAEDGDWAGALARLQAIEKATRASDPEARAQLLHDLAQAHRFAAEASDPDALGRALRVMRAASALQPKERRYRAGIATLARDLQNAQVLQWQRAAAAHNHGLAQRGLDRSTNAKHTGRARQKGVVSGEPATAVPEPSPQAP